MKIEDIAKLAKVSKSAVSLALNNKPGVSQATRERILDIVKESGYVHRTMVKAQQLYGSMKKLRFLACVRSDVVSPQYQHAPFFVELIHGLEEEARLQDYTLVVSSIKQEAMQQELEELEHDHASEGILLLGTNLSEEDVRVVMQQQPHTIVVDALFETVDIDCVVMNNRMGAYQAAQYLMDSGHQHIGYVQSFTRIENFELRKTGFSDALAERDLKLSNKHVFSVNPVIEKVHETFKEQILAEKSSLPTALFCENDYIAIGVIKTLQELHIAVPQEISVIGFDNIPESTIISPELTTIHVEKEEMGEVAVRRLAEIIRPKRQPTLKTMLNTRLIERKSCCSL